MRAVRLRVSERRTTELVGYLLRQGHAVDVFAGKWDPCLVAPSPRFIHVPSRRFPRWMGDLSFANNAARLVVAGQGYDIVHSQAHTLVQDVVTAGGGCHAMWLEIARSLRPGIAGWYAQRKIAQSIAISLERRQMAATKALIANSELSRNGFIERGLIDRDRTHVVRNGVDADAFSPSGRLAIRAEARSRLGFADDGIVLMHIGAGFERKGVRESMRAFAHVAHRVPNMRLAIVGKGRTAPYARLARELGCADLVRFIGHVAPVEHAYAAADIFILLTHFDPFANSTMEALAAGLCVVTTNMNGVSEILTDGGNGIVVDSRAHPEIVAARIAPLADPELRATLGNAGRRLIESGYTWDAAGANTVAVYEHVIRERG